MTFYLKLLILCRTDGDWPRRKLGEEARRTCLLSTIKEMLPSAALLRRVGEKLYGQHWQADLSSWISVGDRSLRRWLSGQDVIPDGVWRDLRLLVETSWIDLRELEYQIRDQQKILVHAFRKWNQGAGDFDVSPIKATKDYIARHRCEPIEGSEQYVEHWEIDSEGRYRPMEAAPLSVSDVMSMTDGYGFHILNEHKAPELTVVYTDERVAADMRRLVTEAVGKATQITVHRR